MQFVSVITHWTYTFLNPWALNRPGVAGAVQQSPPSLTDSFIHWVVLKSKYFPNTVNPKPEELGSWNFERMFIPPHIMCHVSCVTGHLSPVTFQMSYVKKNICFLKIYKKKIIPHIKLHNVVELVDGGSVNTGPTPSSLLIINRHSTARWFYYKITFFGHNL